MCTLKLDLLSAISKLRRAKLHLLEAQRIADRFVKRNPYTMFKCDYGDGWHGLGIARIKPPPADLALAIGDAANCLHAALDHIAFACAIGCPADKEKLIEFPIYETAQQYSSALGKFQQWIVPAALPLFEKFQPRPTQQFPNAWSLIVLREVNNRDKHRSISLVHSLGKRATFTANDPNAIVDVETLTPGRLQIGTILTRFKLRDGALRDDVQMQGDLVMVPIFGEGMPSVAIGKSAVNTLVIAFNFINTEILPAFRRL